MDGLTYFFVVQVFYDCIEEKVSAFFAVDCQSKQRKVGRVKEEIILKKKLAKHKIL